MDRLVGQGGGSYPSRDTDPKPCAGPLRPGDRGRSTSPLTLPAALGPGHGGVLSAGVKGLIRTTAWPGPESRIYRLSRVPAMNCTAVSLQDLPGRARNVWPRKGLQAPLAR